MKHSNAYDILIIGSGAAGLATALTLANDKSVAIISKDDLLSGSSQYAQGGIAAVIDQTAENIDSHIQDTLSTGDGLCDPDVVSFTINHAKKSIEWLINHGVQFTTEPHSNALHFNQEGGHTQRRVIHAADHTGAVIVKTLLEQVFEHPNIDCFSQQTAIDLITQNQQCQGAFILDNRTQSVQAFYAKATILACGGASSVYQHTTNPDQTTGDGIAMAWRAGCQIEHMEFTQFHPTCLFYSGKEPFLISEALRGEGGKLRLPNGQAFMSAYDPRAELAPRDIVTRAIHEEMRQHAIDHVLLDISHQSPHMIRSHFPTIHDFCYQQGIDITQSPIPVVPAAHYTCGGVKTNLQAQTNLARLYAIGETAETGLHGANRMASNSLLECLVFSASASEAILTTLESDFPSTTIDCAMLNRPHQNTQDYKQGTKQLQQLMWDNVGIIRNTEDLLSAKTQLQKASKDINTSFYQTAITRESIEYRNSVDTALLITNSALSRGENCGLHYNETLSAVRRDTKV